MQKRYQVLLPDWLEDYIKNISKSFDLSFSEVIRLELCFSILTLIRYYHPDYEVGISPEDVFDQIKSYSQGKLQAGEMQKTISDIYFEARKVVEYRLSHPIKVIK